MSLIKRPSELTFTPIIKALLYGQPGIGKTTLALSAPSPLMIDCDKGVHRINPIHLKDTVQVSKWEDIDAVLSEDLSAYQTIIIDTAGKMIEYMTDFIMRSDPRLRQGDGSLSLKGYGARKVMFKNLFSRVTLLGKNIVFVAHDIEERDGDVRFVRPEIGGSSGNDLMKELDLVGYMGAQGKKKTISFDATEKYYGKNTCNLPEIIEVPDASQGGNVLLSTIFGQYGDMLEKKSEMRVKYNKLLDHIESVVENIDTLNKLNKATVDFQAMEHIWDSRVQSAKRVHAKAKELAFVFDREQGKYVIPAPSTETQPQGSVEQTEQHSNINQGTPEVPNESGIPVLINMAEVVLGDNVGVTAINHEIATGIPNPRRRTPRRPTE